ncbi:MAG TPA: WD40 repeat domain-containing protein, partial [Nannocystis sp.]
VADDPALRLLLAVEAVAVRTERGEAPTIEAQQALLEALAGPRSDLFARPGAAAVDAVAESDDGRWLATGERAGTVALWSTEAPRAPADVLEGTGEVRGLAWSAEGALAIVRAGAPPVVATRAGQGSLQEHVSWDISLAEPRDPQWSGRGALVVRDNAHAVILQAGAAARAIGGGAPLRKARWSPDGAQLLTAAADGALQLWPADGGEPRSLRLPGPAVGLVTAEWRGDGREVVVGRADGSVVLVPIGGGVARRLVGHTDEVYAASYVPGGQQVVSVSRDGTARVWDASGGSEAIELQGHAEVLLGVQVSAGGDLLLGAPAGGEAWLWQLEVRGPPLRLRGHEGSVVATGFSRDGARVLTGSSDGSARRFRIADDPWLLRGHAAGIEQAIAHPDGRTVLTSSLDGTIRVWPRDGRGAHRLGGHREGGAPLLALSPDGRRLLSAGGDGRVRVWSLAGEKPVPEASIQGERGVAFLDASWSPTGDVVALAGEDGRVSLLRLAGDGPPSLVRQAVHTGSVRVLKFMPNGTSIASAGDPGDVVVTSLEFDVKAMFEGHAGPVRTLAVSGDGGRLASAGDDGVVRIWSLADPGAAPLELRGHEGSIGQVVLRPDGAAALTAAADGTAREWPLHGGEPAVLRGHEDAVWVALYSPDGAMILTASADGNARLWTREAEGWTALILPHAPAGGPGEPERALWTGAFSPDGRFVVTAGADGLARVFPVRLADRVAEACARAGRDLTPDEWRHHLGDRPYRRTCL